MMRIELTYLAWKASVLPLNYTRKNLMFYNEFNSIIILLKKQELFYNKNFIFCHRNKAFRVISYKKRSVETPPQESFPH